MSFEEAQRTLNISQCSQASSYFGLPGMMFALSLKDGHIHGESIVLEE
jgi:hypothetical protein